MPTSLLQAKLRGIRSYSPFEHKTQVIEFMPLTLIVGNNGCGKTSVIEALKFIISGEEPPLSDSRRNFLHTSNKPNNCFDKGTPYASIELLFQNSRDEICTAKRDITRGGVGKSNATPSISSCYQIGKGPWKNVHKKEDWVKTIPQLFDLPNQAILSHVILCHQEDNLWCMSDSTTVKQIFDKIFGCERYKKEVRYIDAEIKACKTKLSLDEKDLLRGKDRLDQMKKLKEDEAQKKEEIEKLRIATDDISAKMKSVMEEKEQVRFQIEDLENKDQDIFLQRYKLKELSEKDQSTRKALKRPVIEPDHISDTDLQIMLDQNKQLVDTTKKRLAEIKTRESELRLELDQMEDQKENVQHLINKLKVIELKSKESLVTLSREIDSIKQNNPSLSDLDSADLKISLEALASFEKKLQQDKSDQAELEDNLSATRDQLAKDINKLEVSFHGLVQKINGKENIVEQLTEQLAQADPMAKDLKQVSRNLRKMTGITAVVPRSAHLSSLIEPLEKLIEDTDTIVNNLLEKVKNDSLLKLTNDIDGENASIELARHELDTIQEKKEILVKEQIQVQDEQSKARAAAKDAHNKSVIFRTKRQNLQNIYGQYTAELKFIETKNLTEKMKDMERISSKIEAIKFDLSSLNQEKSKLTEDVGKSFEEHTELSLNIELRSITNRSKEIEAKIAQIEEEMGDRKASTKLKQKLEEMEQHYAELRDKYVLKCGLQQRIERELKDLKPQLAGHNLTRSTYAEILGNLVCNKLILSDLEKLKECFQQSISTFHNQMIVKINEVLRVRWRQIYQGADIELIELVDEEITKGKDVKAYNYYIAMRKSGIRMKMREKASSGQKALASIILRMTLAELFVKDFAFIALDEPTANLDLKNVQSLAKAIGNYVKRKAKRGFNIQWIIITHDELFLRSLDAESSPYYYRVGMDEEGHSRITKISSLDTQSSASASSNFFSSGDTQRTETSAVIDVK